MTLERGRYRSRHHSYVTNNTGGNPKLSDEEIARVRLVRKQTKMSHQKLADLFGVGKDTISRALRRDETVKLSDFAVMR